MRMVSIRNINRNITSIWRRGSILLSAVIRDRIFFGMETCGINQFISLGVSREWCARQNVSAIRLTLTVGESVAGYKPSHPTYSCKLKRVDGYNAAKRSILSTAIESQS